jgi:hypothetical protein
LNKYLGGLGAKPPFIKEIGHIIRLELFMKNIEKCIDFS